MMSIVLSWICKSYFNDGFELQNFPLTKVKVRKKSNKHTTFRQRSCANNDKKIQFVDKKERNQYI